MKKLLIIQIILSMILQILWQTCCFLYYFWPWGPFLLQKKNLIATISTSFFSFVRFWCLRNRAHVLMTQLDRTLAKSLHCQLGNLRSHVSSSHIVPVTQSKHKSLVPHSLIIQTGSLLVCQGTYLNCKWYQKALGVFKIYVELWGKGGWLQYLQYLISIIK